jgi:phospholipid/cholesterol/gamma-HCH transport system substrate-binding protein
MITRLPARGTLLLAIAFVLGSVLLTLYVWRSVGGTLPLQPKGYRVTALFDNASQLTRNADVRISGVDIGKVVAIRQRRLRTEATIDVEARFAPLRRDVRAILRQKTLLGETFVELTPGSRSAPLLPEGGQIPREQIADTQPLDRVLGMLDRPTRERLQELLVDGGALLDGRGADLNAALGNLAPATSRLAAALRILDHQRSALRTLVRDTGTVLQTVGDERESVAELVRAGHRALSATAARDAALTAAVRATPELLGELRDTSAAAAETATLAAPVLDELRPVAPLVAPALAAARDAAPQLARLLEGVGSLVPTARAALPAATRIIDGLSPLTSVLEPAVAQVSPVIDYMAAYRRELVATMANVTASTNGRSAATDGRLTPYLRTLIPNGPETIVGYSRRSGSNRHNAYREPGGLAALAEGLTSANCEHAAESSDAPACRVQRGWSFGGGPARYFQHVEPARPPGAIAAIRRVLRAFGADR